MTAQILALYSLTTCNPVLWTRLHI